MANWIHAALGRSREVGIRRREQRCSENAYFCDSTVQAVWHDYHASLGLYHRTRQEEFRQQFENNPVMRHAYFCDSVVLNWDCINPVSEEYTKRALELLLSCLTNKQKIEFENTNSFTVKSPSNRTYRIRWGNQYNVDLLDDFGFVHATFCALPVGGLPVADVMLAQKLMLENDEQRFLKVANKQEGNTFRGLEDLVNRIFDVRL